jgi:hypothetical protein
MPIHHVIHCTGKSCWLIASCDAFVLSACGGGSSGQSDVPAAVLSDGAASANFSIEPDAVPADAASVVAEPTFHLAPVVLDAPSDADAVDSAASALNAPHVQSIAAGLAGLQTRGLTVQVLEQAQRAHALGAPVLGADGTAAPMASSSVVSTYTPAQIRAAYALPPLPGSGVTPTAAQAAQLGAGQTIYIVDAMHDPNVLAELSAFNQKFGLPSCTARAIPASTKLPLAAAILAEGCVFSVIYSTPSATMTATAPAYDAGWATEITLDVQWAHATAPLARIVLIEAPDASLAGLLGAIKLAGAMGPGAVSMSFGAGEGSWTASVDSAFTGAGMTYLAATGDSGSAVSWPAVSANVLAVGGTTLTYTGSAARSEVGWSRTGGGISLYTPTPSYQSQAVPGVGLLAHRAVADVAFNADPASGQYVAVIAQGSSAVNWVSAGGTSLSTPQWAGLAAIASALRAQGGKPLLGAPHGALYGQIGAVPGTYASAFADITKGANGTCATCAAKAGYDQPTGLGTPNATALLSALSGAGAGAVATAPMVTPATVNGKVGTPLAFAVNVTSSGPVSLSLSNTPAGMTISSAGVVNWASPVAGSYAVTVTATNTVGGLSGKGIYTVVIAAPQPPTITAIALSGVAGKSLSGTITFADPGGYALMVTITGIPVGITLKLSGQTLLVNWPSPVAGKYTLNVTAKDSAGLTAQATVPITIAAK